METVIGNHMNKSVIFLLLRSYSQNCTLIHVITLIVMTLASLLLHFVQTVTESFFFIF